LESGKPLAGGHAGAPGMIYLLASKILFQTFDQDCVVDVFAANEGESFVIGRERQMWNFVSAQVAD
jgi:hypothetical protein